MTVSDREYLRAAARDVAVQAADGLGVEVDAELADYMGAFNEDAVTLEDVLADNAATASGEIAREVDDA